jgi:hypothetical protein
VKSRVVFVLERNLHLYDRLIVRHHDRGLVGEDAAGGLDWTGYDQEDKNNNKKEDLE